MDPARRALLDQLEAHGREHDAAREDRRERRTRRSGVGRAPRLGAGVLAVARA
jgi:hypothetical protein